MLRFHPNTPCLWFFPLFCLFIAMSSCGSPELDRGKAAELLEQHYSYPYVEFESFQVLGNVNPKRGQDNVPTEATNGVGQYVQKWVNISPLVEAGLLTRGQGRRVEAYSIAGTPKRYGPSLTYTFTKQLSMYLEPGTDIQTNRYGRHNFNAMICEIHLGEVTGIKFDESRTSAQVEYRIERRNHTPLRLLWVHPRPDQESKSVQFDLYDDGWRIKDDFTPQHVSVERFEQLTSGLREYLLQERQTTPTVTTKEDSNQDNSSPSMAGTRPSDCDICLTYYGERKDGQECIQIESDGSFRHYWRCSESEPANYGTWRRSTFQGKDIIALQLPSGVNSDCWLKHEDCRLVPGINTEMKRFVVWNGMQYTER